jgi:hypothetical protein
MHEILSNNSDDDDDDDNNNNNTYYSINYRYFASATCLQRQMLRR